MQIHPIPRATGCSISATSLTHAPERMVDIRDFGAIADGDPVINTRAVNAAIADAAHNGGGTVRIPTGRFPVYTIMLASLVNLFLDEGAVLAAARPEGHDHAALHDVTDAVPREQGASMGGGNYAEPEINRYVGLQDHAHTYLHNSLVLGVHVHDVMIYGPGRFDGSWVDPVTGVRSQNLTYGDPQEPEHRGQHGHSGDWWGDKGIALVDSERVALCDFQMLLCGHFAIIATGCNDVLIDGVGVDSQRDGVDIDGCRDVTIRNSWFNTLHDDAIVIKASYGAQRFAHTRNVLVEDCVVSGYDAGSVLAGHPSRDRQTAEGGCGPMGRVKLGTESTCGYSLVTIRRVRFERCMGLAIEAVDGSDVEDVVAEHLVMDDVTSAPIYIRCGDRGRFPVTGVHTAVDGEWVRPVNDVRLDNPQWVLPQGDGYEVHPARRYAPAYCRTAVSVDGCSTFPVVDPDNPVRLNRINVHTAEDGVYHPMVWNEQQGCYVPDYATRLDRRGALSRGNAFGSPTIAACRHIQVSDVTATNVDPRYPIILAGVMDAPAYDIRLHNIDVTLRGGISMRDAVEQRMLRTVWRYRETDMAPDEQLIPWLINPGHAHHESLLPRVDWDCETGTWRDDPYNVPEGVSNYPDPDEFGILPACGMYARHVQGLTVSALRIATEHEDGRHAVVLDDVHDARFENMDFSGIIGDSREPVSDCALVSHSYKRPTGYEYLPDEPYRATDVEAELPEGLDVEHVHINAPEPGTPPDALYHWPTIATTDNGFSFHERAWGVLPRYVYMPYLVSPMPVHITVGQHLDLPLQARDPADPKAASFTYDVSEPPQGMAVHGSRLRWTPLEYQRGTYAVQVTVCSDGRRGSGTVHITVE